MKNDKGFTLIELMVVISIIGILAAIAIPNFIAYRNRAVLVEAYGIADAIRKDILTYYDHVGIFPEDNRQAGLAPPEQIRGKYVASVKVIGGAIDIRLSDDSPVPRDYRGKILSLRPAIQPENPTAPVIWIREKASVPKGLKVIGEDHTTI